MRPGDEGDDFSVTDPDGQELSPTEPYISDKNTTTITFTNDNPGETDSTPMQVTVTVTKNEEVPTDTPATVVVIYYDEDGNEVYRSPEVSNCQALINWDYNTAKHTIDKIRICHGFFF